MGNNYYEYYLAHHGILGQKWGVRRYQNPDGTLTEEGKRHKSAYITANLKARPVATEGQKLINQSKRLQSDFGDSYSNVDDEDFFESVAKSYGLNTSSYSNKRQDYVSFVNQNYESIKTGEQIVRMIMEQEKRK